MRIFWDLFENGTIVKHTDNNSTIRGGVMRGLPVPNLFWVFLLKN